MLRITPKAEKEFLLAMSWRGGHWCPVHGWRWSNTRLTLELADRLVQRGQLLREPHVAPNGVKTVMYRLKVAA